MLGTRELEWLKSGAVGKWHSSHDKNVHLIRTLNKRKLISSEHPIRIFTCKYCKSLEPCRTMFKVSVIFKELLTEKCKETIAPRSQREVQ